MPSNPNYKRDYVQERKVESDKRRRQRAARHRARAAMVKAGKVKKGDGKQVDHKKPLSRGGTNKRSNLRVTTPRKNTSYARKSSGAIK